MPISINGSGTISGISVGGLENGCVNEADLATAAVTNTKLASNAVTIDKMGSAEQSGLCKAWVNFNGTGTVAIRASYNVSSITDNGVGDYTVNFTTAMVDANYLVVGASAKNSSIGAVPIGIQSAATPTTTAVRIESGYFSTNVRNDFDTVGVAIFR
jgi:hypothetical protein